MYGISDVTVSQDKQGISLVDLSNNGKIESLHLNASDVLKLPAASTGLHQLKVLGDNTDVIDLNKVFADGQSNGQWTQSGAVTQDGQTFNVYNHSGDQTLQVLIDQHIQQANVHVS